MSIPDGADLVSLSGHKLGAGRGGILFVRDGVRLDPILYGGPQEWGRRAGREDVNAAVAVATALAVCARDRESRAHTANRQAESLRRLLQDLGGRLTGATPQLPNFATCSFADRRGEDMLLALDIAGVAASSGSACASGSLDPSHVLLAMGLTLDYALGSLRLTTGYNTTDDDVSRAEELLAIVNTLPPGGSPLFLQAHSLRFRARLAGRSMKPEEADRLFARAGGLFRELAIPFYLAVTLLEQGEWLLTQDRGDEAQPLLAEAHATFERLEATPWLERAARSSDVRQQTEAVT